MHLLEHSTQNDDLTAPKHSVGAVVSVYAIRGLQLVTHGRPDPLPECVWLSSTHLVDLSRQVMQNQFTALAERMNTGVLL